VTKYPRPLSLKNTIPSAVIHLLKHNAPLLLLSMLPISPVIPNGIKLLRERAETQTHSDQLIELPERSENINSLLKGLRRMVPRLD
jgi:hypothetical protein